MDRQNSKRSDTSLPVVQRTEQRRLFTIQASPPPGSSVWGRADHQTGCDKSLLSAQAPYLVSLIITSEPEQQSSFQPVRGQTSPAGCSNTNPRLAEAKLKTTLPDVALNALSILRVPVTRQMVLAMLPGIRSKQVTS